jgi:MYXO-CTERM domain-containing protein
MKLRLVCFSAMALFASSSFALQTYTNQTNWASNVNNAKSLGFAGLVESGGYEFEGDGGPVVDDFGFTGAFSTYVVDDAYDYGLYGTAPVFSDQMNPDPYIDISVPKGVTAMGFLVQAWDSKAAKISINGSLNDAFNVALAPNDPSFFGFLTYGQITTISISDIGAGVLNLQEVWYGKTNTAPSPAAVIPFGLGLLGAIRRRRRNQAG